MNIERAHWTTHREIRWLITGILVLAVWGVSITAWAQSSRSSSSRNSGGGSWTQSNSAYSTGSLGGTSSTSGSRTGSGSTASGSISSQLEQAASNTQFSRSSRGAENFVGADSSDSRNILGYENSTQSGNRTGRNSRTTTRSAYSNSNRSTNRNYSSYGSNGYGTQGNRSRYGQSSVSVQPTLSLGFDYAGPVVPNLATKLASRLKTSAVATAALPVQVQVLDGTATLTGTVASDHERALAEQLLALEPGVRRVDNQLSVGPPAPK